MTGFLKPARFDWQHIDLQEMLRDLRHAVACARLALFAQAFAVLREVAAAKQWTVNLSEVARVLRGGSLLRCSLLET